MTARKARKVILLQSNAVYKIFVGYIFKFEKWNLPPTMGLGGKKNKIFFHSNHSAENREGQRTWGIISFINSTFVQEGDKWQLFALSHAWITVIHSIIGLSPDRVNALCMFCQTELIWDFAMKSQVIIMFTYALRMQNQNSQLHWYGKKI